MSLQRARPLLPFGIAEAGADVDTVVIEGVTRAGTVMAEAEVVQRAKEHLDEGRRVCVLRLLSREAARSVSRLAFAAGREAAFAWIPTWAEERRGGPKTTALPTQPPPRRTACGTLLILSLCPSIPHTVVMSQIRRALDPQAIRVRTTCTRPEGLWLGHEGYVPLPLPGEFPCSRVDLSALVMSLRRQVIRTCDAGTCSLHMLSAWGRLVPESLFVLDFPVGLGMAVAIGAMADYALLLAPYSTSLVAVGSTISLLETTCGTRTLGVLFSAMVSQANGSYVRRVDPATRQRFLAGASSELPVAVLGDLEEDHCPAVTDALTRALPTASTGDALPEEAASQAARTQPPSRALRDATAGLLQRMRAKGALRARRVSTAFQRTPRHVFVSGVWPWGWPGQPYVAVSEHHLTPEALRLSYEDAPLPLRPDRSLVLPQPSVIAHMLAALKVESGQFILEIGTGTGYTAALLARLNGRPERVVSVDIDSETVQQAARNLARTGMEAVQLGVADVASLQPDASYDRVLVSTGLSRLPCSLVAQVSDGGVLVFPWAAFGARYHVTPLVRVQRVGTAMVGSVVTAACNFLPACGEAGRDLGLLLDQFRLDFHAAKCQVVALPPRLTSDDAGLRTDAWHDFWFFARMQLSPEAKLVRWYDGSVCGLSCGDGTGAAVIPLGQCIAFAGERGASVCQRLHSLLGQWESLGQPNMADWTLTFSPSAEAQNSIQGKEQTWCTLCVTHTPHGSP